MRRAGLGQKGFTLMEVIVVLAVIAALTAVLVPVVFRYIDDARKGQAQSDANTIAAAIQQMYKDTGRWPFYVDGKSTKLKKDPADAAVLTSNGAVSFATLSTDTTVPGPSGGFTGWATTLTADNLANQLISNGPGYVTSSGSRAWKGPYLDKIPAVDPWGKSYLVNIGNADPNLEGASQPWTIVISAGPNGEIETTGTTAGTGNPQVGGDDIIARVK